VRMEEVAAQAGVSMITVSRALAHPHLVKPQTRQAVEAAVKALGYVPNLQAGSLASRRSHIIGAIVPSIDNSIFAATVRALGETLGAAGYQLLLGQSNYNKDAEDRLVAAFLGRRVDGLVLTGGQHSAMTRKRLLAAGIPVVETWDLPARPIGLVAGFSNRAAGTAMCRHMLGQGRTRLCYLGGEDERSRARLQGVEAAFRGGGGVSLQVLRIPTGAGFEGGAKALQDLWLGCGHRAEAMPQAWLCANDALAAGVLMECHRLGLKVPQQVAVMGFADVGMGATLHPRLSSVRVPMQEMGLAAAEMILATLGGEAPGGSVRDLGFELVLRESA
jgi:LacI family transcriptional regulator, gluconate utilization system Gnt-I transcriptional repressor